MPSPASRGCARERVTLAGGLLLQKNENRELFECKEALLEDFEKIDQIDKGKSPSTKTKANKVKRAYKPLPIAFHALGAAC